MTQSFNIRITQNGKYVVETYKEDLLSEHQTFSFDSLQEVFEAADEFFPSDDGVCLTTTVNPPLT